MAAAVGAALVASSLCSGPAAAALGVRPGKATGAANPALRPERPVASPAADPAAAAAWRKGPEVTWPAAGAAEVSLPAVAAATTKADAADKPDAALSWTKADGLPVRVGYEGARPTSTVRVEVLDQAAARAAHVPGVLLRVRHADRVARPMSVEVDYTGFRYAYGGDFGSRLRLVRLPDCALTTPTAAACGGEVVASRNDTASGKVSGQVSDGLFAVTAAPSGSAGSFQPTSLAPSATWQVGLQSGDFSWSYPLRLPPMPGRTPDLGLSYSSGSVDGRTAATNNQPSWAGEGFELPTGFIERSYKPCRDDGQPASNGDLCWETHNAVLVLPGVASGQLVPQADNKSWRLEDDRGWRVDLLTDTTNDDNDHEYWRLTSPEGTQYFFGRTAAANSTWTVPVFGNENGEPCHGATFATSWCQQAYRWQLDYVVDRHGDAVSYSYDRETNYYARGGTTPTQYVRGGYLSRIEYGLRAGSTAPAAARVVLTPADRCVPGTACSLSRPQDWPDTPLDQSCDGTSCANVAPTFWLTKRLAAVTTQVRAGSSYQNVDSWTLTHSFPDPGELSPPGLWLQSIVHTGHTGPNGATASLPAVTFTGTRNPNRVDPQSMDPMLNKWRLETIRTETGGRIVVSYARAACDPAALPPVDANNKQCFPAYWLRSGATSPSLDWFNKYVVQKVVEDDATAAPEKVTEYQYLSAGDAAWHYDGSDLVPPGRKTWGQWRGFQKVRVLTGLPGDQTVTDHLFLQGMNGDKKVSGTRVADVGDSRGGTVSDQPFWRGFARETTVYNGVNGAWVSTEVTEPGNLGTTAARAGDSGTTLEAHLVAQSWKQTYTALAGGGTRETKTVYEYDDFGTMSKVDDQGDVSTPADDTCTRNTYIRNTTAWIVNTVARVETVGVRCGATASYPGDLISDRRFSYDGLAWGAAPVKGDLTRTEEAASWSSGAPAYVTVSQTTPDAHGRPVTQLDALGNRTTIAYTPATGGPVTEVATTNPLGHVTRTVLDPCRGLETATEDANGGRTNLAYDPLGRLVSVWLPGRATSASPNLRYQYALRANGAAVTTQRLLGGASYLTSFEVYDGLMRPRQTQEPAPGGGRIVTDTVYDEHGRVKKKSGPQHDDGAPDASLLSLTDADVDAQTRFGYDGAGRETSQAFVSLGTERWRTTTTYGGDWTAEDPADGATATMTLVDARGRTVELRQYTGGAPTGSYDTTRYTYTKAGRLATVTDSGGNVWRYTYDLRGRQTRADAPDTGATARTFDAAGRPVSTTDARNRTVSYTYDALGRRTGTFEGSTRLAGWTYDTVQNGKGLLASSTRYVGTDAYISAVTGYDPQGHRTGVDVTIPQVETGLGKTYSTAYTYDETGRVKTMTPPAVNGLPAETLTYAYDELGLPAKLSSAEVRYVDDTSRDGLGRVSYRASSYQGRQVSREYQWDLATGRLDRTAVYRDATSDTVVADVGYTYDPAGNVRSVTDAPEGAAADGQCFRYDGLRRLTEAWTPAGECAAAPSQAALGGAAAYWHSYTYDNSGNRLTEVQHAGTGDTVRAYTYPAAGTAQPHTLRSVTTTGPGVSRTDSYGYDARGGSTSRTAGGQTRQLTWDAEGRVSTVVDSSGTTQYLYDADGNRLLRRQPGAVTLYLGDTEVRRDGSGTVKGTRYYGLDDGAVAVRSGGTLSWLVTDPHGTAEATVDATSLAVTRRYRLPFGGVRGAEPATWAGEQDFLGGGRDPGGLIHLGAREYDPAVGGFVSADPVTDHRDPQQVQAYGYANGNPATFVDPDGRKPRKPPYNPDTYYFDYWACDSFGSMCDGYADPTGGVDSWDILSNVFAPNVNRDAARSDVYSCYDDNPQPAVACRDLPVSSEDQAPVLVYAQLPCSGWDQCISPRPMDWVDQDELGSAEAPGTFAAASAPMSKEVMEGGSPRLTDSQRKVFERWFSWVKERIGLPPGGSCRSACGGGGTVWGGPYQAPSGKTGTSGPTWLRDLRSQAPRGGPSGQPPLSLRFGGGASSPWPGGGVVVLG